MRNYKIFYPDINECEEYELSLDEVLTGGDIRIIPIDAKIRNTKE